MFGGFAPLPLRLGGEVSVRSSAGSLRVTIKDPSVKRAIVEAIASPHEHIDRDERTGDILRGGNTFLTVEYSDEALAPIVDRVLPQLIEIENSEQPGIIREIEGFDVWFLANDSFGGSFRAAPKGWDDDMSDYVAPMALFGAHHAAKRIAEMSINA